MDQRPIHPLHIVALGSAALCAQSVFVRELFALFTGTELVIGALLASWLFWVGAGALAGGRLVSRHRARRVSFVRIAVASSALVPLTVLGIRVARFLIVRPPGSLAPLGAALAASFLVVAPFGFLYGTAYNVASILWRERGGSLREGIARVYLWEAAGSVFGALLFSFVLIPFFSQLEAALITGLLLVAVIILPLQRGRLRIAQLAAFAVAVFISGSVMPSLDRWSIERSFAGYRVERFYSSRYGEIVVAGQEEVRSVFADGGRLFSHPEPERAQETVHIPLLLHPAPRSVLLVGGALGGGWQEAVKHPSVESVECVELDGSLFAIDIGAGAARDTTVPRADGSAARVRFVAADGRFHLAAGRRRYDAVIVSAPAPVNLQWNRFFTREFFGIVRRSLAPGGILALSHPSSENFLSEDQLRVLRSLELTLRREFPRVLVLPGSTAHFIAGEEAVDPGDLLPRLEERRIDAPYVSGSYLPFRFSPERIDELRAELDRAGTAALNSDARPLLPFYEIVLEGTRQGASSLVGALRLVPGAASPWTLAVAAAVLAALFGFARGGMRPRLAVWAVGFGGFLLQLIVLLGFQSFSGLLYQAVVMLTAVFMAGAAAGAYLSLRRGRWRTGALRWIHVCVIALAAALVAWFSFVGSGRLSYAPGAAVFLLFAAAGGMLTGGYYPIVVRTAFPEDGAVVPAAFYAWDLFGACVAGATGGILLFPLLGLAGTALAVMIVHALAALLLAGRW